MKSFINIISSLLYFIIGIILLPLCVIIGVLCSFYFTYEIISMYFKTANEALYKQRQKKDE